MRKRENPENLVGKKFNKLLVVKHLGMRPTCTYTDKKTGKKHIMTSRFYLYRCECGREKEVPMSNLKRQKGCRYCGAKKTNPKSKHPSYKYWAGMISRNYNKSGGCYKLRDKYSIRVCDRWLTSFDAFVKDLSKPPTPKHILGRIDINKGYAPDNCKWFTRSERQKTRKHSNELTLTNISEQVGITRERIRQITNIALKNKEDELNDLIARIDYINTNKRVVFKPEAIEYFKKKKYFLKTKYKQRSELIFKEYYLKGIDMETAAKQLNKPIISIKRYYKKFASAIQAESIKKD